MWVIFIVALAASFLLESVLTQASIETFFFNGQARPTVVTDIYTGIARNSDLKILAGARRSNINSPLEVNLFLDQDFSNIGQTSSQLDMTDLTVHFAKSDRLVFVASGKLVMVPWIWNPDLISGSFSSEVSSSSPFSSVLEYLDFNRTDTDWFLAANSLSLIRVDPSTFMQSGTFTTLPNPLGGGAPPLRMRMYQSDFVLAQSTSIGLQGHCLFRFTDSTPSMYTKITSALRQSLARTDLGMFVTMRGSRRVFDLSPLSATTSGLASVDVELDEVVQWSPSGVINDSFLAFELIDNLNYLFAINNGDQPTTSLGYIFSALSLTLVFSDINSGSNNFALTQPLPWHRVFIEPDYYTLSSSMTPDSLFFHLVNSVGQINKMAVTILCPLPYCKRCSVERAATQCDLCLSFTNNPNSLLMMSTCTWTSKLVPNGAYFNLNYLLEQELIFHLLMSREFSPVLILSAKTAVQTSHNAQFVKVDRTC
jgi:hypothetical protein